MASRHTCNLWRDIRRRTAVESGTQVADFVCLPAKLLIRDGRPPPRARTCMCMHTGCLTWHTSASIRFGEFYTCARADMRVTSPCIYELMDAYKFHPRGRSKLPSIRFMAVFASEWPSISFSIICSSAMQRTRTITFCRAISPLSFFLSLFLPCRRFAARLAKRVVMKKKSVVTRNRMIPLEITRCSRMKLR